MKYLLLISFIALFLSATANARDWQVQNPRDQLYTVGVAAGTYILGNIFEDQMGMGRTEAYLSSGLLVGTGMFIWDYYGEKDNQFQKHKSQGTMIGVGFSWVITLGFGL